MIISDAQPGQNRSRTVALTVGVAVVHAVLFAAFGLTRVEPLSSPSPDFPSIEVLLVQRPSPPPDPSLSTEAGGGAPAAPSRVHVAPEPPRVQPELMAPVEPSAAPDPILVGLAPLPDPESGLGQGGEGAGRGSGFGTGDGPGGGTGARILRGPSQGEILQWVPVEARRARIAGRAALDCEILPDTRLRGCRVVSETPQGYAFGQAALEIAPRYFRFRPPMTASGQVVEGARVTVGVEFGRQR